MSVDITPQAVKRHLAEIAEDQSAPNETFYLIRRLAADRDALSARVSELEDTHEDKANAWDMLAKKNERIAELEGVANKLYRLLDDIDTADDLAKADEKLYRNLVRHHHKLRFEFHSLFDPDGDVSEFNQPPT